jgi:AAA domain/CHC2 zinc finger
MSVDIEEAKQRLPLPALMHQCGLGKHAKKSARCPFHDDRHNSFSVWKNGSGRWHWKCHAGCGEGDEINFLQLHRGISQDEAMKMFLEMAGINGARLAAKRQSTSAFDWLACVEAFRQEHIEQLAKSRGYSVELCRWLKEEKLIGLHDGCIAFPIRDKSQNVVAAHYKPKTGDSKWLRYPKGFNTRPIVIGKSLSADPVHAFESQWDAFAFMDVSGERSGIVITLGASNSALVADAIPKTSTVYLWTQNDAAGGKWEAEICINAKATVKRVQIPIQFKDLNDWTRAGATDKDLVAAILSAETIHQNQKSWLEALNESVITASELRGLDLVRRRKLLGDWFCEGDLGFIFAFRGVGKTWLALGIAQALSTGGKLGAWQAHERVKVLYVDGEMPPDLMRSRSEGLQATNANLHFLNHEILFERAGRVLNIANPEVQRAITERCTTTGAKVLMLDNLSTLASGVRENEADSWEQVNNWLLDLRRRKIAVLIIHHAGRSGEMRGTSKREDNVFWIIALDDAKKNVDDKRGARFISRFTKPSRNTQEEVPAYEWHFLTDEATGAVSIGCKQAQTMDVFRQLIEDGVTDCSDLAEEMKVSKGTISKWAHKAIREGWLRKEGRGYGLKEPALAGNEAP